MTSCEESRAEENRGESRRFAVANVIAARKRVLSLLIGDVFIYAGLAPRPRLSHAPPSATSFCHAEQWRSLLEIHVEGAPKLLEQFC